MLNRKLDARVSDELLGYPGRSKLGHRPGAIFLAGPPLEELLQGAVLAAGVGIAVAAQQPHHPPLDVLPADQRPSANRAVRPLSPPLFALAGPRHDGEAGR